METGWIFDMNHRRKMIAPIIITILVILYYGLYFGFLISVIDIPILKILTGIIPVAIGAGMVIVCIQRIREIQEGEEDDLSQY